MPVYLDDSRAHATYYMRPIDATATLVSVLPVHRQENDAQVEDFFADVLQVVSFMSLGVVLGKYGMRNGS